MVAEKFPISRGELIGSVKLNYILENMDKYCFMFRLRLWDVYPKIDADHPLSFSKCRYTEIEEPLLDNGRIYMAKYLETTCTEQDLLTYMDFYGYSRLEIFDCWQYKKQYLPRPFVLAILKLYSDKTTLKGVEGEEVNYQVKKGMLNASFGMTVTDIVREELYYDTDKDSEQPFYSNYDNMTDEEYNKYLETQIARYNSNPYRFLFYAWGVWITAYARRNLFTGIKACAKDYIYADTDSLKILNWKKHMNYIDAYNKEIVEKLKKACDFHEVDFSLTKPKNKFGEEKQLGIWEFEGEYDEFKTLGAKRYLWRKGDKWQLTVAGVNKKSGMKYLLKRAEETNKAIGIDGKQVTPFDFFNMELVVPSEYSGRNVLTYIDDEKKGTVTDYLGETLDYDELSGIHMESTEYSLNPMKQFLDYLFQIREESW